MKLDIKPSSYYDQENGGTIPIFTPTMEEFKDFKLFVESIDEFGKKAGIVKIIPPKEWRDQLPDMTRQLNEIKIKRPITQHIIGNKGVFGQTNIEKRGSYTIDQWFHLCQQREHRPPKIKNKEGKLDEKTVGCTDLDEIDNERLLDYVKNESKTSGLTVEEYKEIERYYWRSLTFNQPMYGADMLGTFFDESTNTWNLNHLDNILNDLDTVVPGVNSPYLYFGMWKATFAWHVEDMDLYSINYIHFGAPKQWYTIAPMYKKKFETFMQNMFYIQYKHCHEFLRHKTFIISPRVLEENGIPVDRCVQQPGEWMITFPFGYHSGYNLDLNCAESVNFALDSWVPIGKEAKACGCIEDTVMIDVNALWGTQPKECVLCPLRQSSALPQHDYYLLSSDMGAVHKVCAKAIDETRIMHRSVKGIEAIPSSRWKLSCIFCKKKMGACMQCCYGKCWKSFHPTCAIEAGATFLPKKVQKGSLYNAYCPEHDPEKVKKQEEYKKHMKEMTDKLKTDLEIYTKDGIYKGKIKKCMPKQKVCKVLLQNGHLRKIYWKDIQLSPPSQ
ncbi:hypothetical protein G6F57_003195 [Rhizopus arrhizus]|uniref:[histone H3]-trimethyl-L-lysine(9) demethylase n=1 Tax=Rhizopus oryzae TaxID=64495 RepID=A0A9P6XF21_RHIOR|nr:hypothetical protein G6F24_002895 [Rhizopus arrhizus]KAG1428178.1 hypothetical protein G6F58_000691 [Rhizopus delemar]KAG0795751.1 hypothetical protein G6F21_001864 [Rhizopus arrhizus]KAG0816982.1 hypothetical protein G6F20_002747 [Rhizopus arrhizus]KAG0839245.1 hypothetical protein G6F19_002684 [Rhizopus arrhizus]